jgi:hypothetical protein
VNFAEVKRSALRGFLQRPARTKKKEKEDEKAVKRKPRGKEG